MYKVIDWSTPLSVGQWRARRACIHSSERQKQREGPTELAIKAAQCT